MENYVITRAHAMFTRLLPPSVIEGLTAAKNLNDLATLLMPTEYGRELVRGKELTEKQFVDAFIRVFEKRVNVLLESAEGYLKDFVEAYFSKYVINIIVSIIRHKLTDTPLKIETIQIPFRERYKFIKNLMETKKITEIVDVLKNTNYAISQEILNTVLKTNNTLLLEFYYKKMYYKNLLEKINKMPRTDRQVIKHILLSYIDIENIFTAVAPFLYEYTPEVVREFIIQPTYKIPMNVLDSILKAKTEKQIRDALFQYRSIVRHLLNRNETLAETEKYRYVKEQVIKQKLLAFVEPTYLFIYISLAEFEMIDLQFIVYATRFAIPPEDKLMHIINIK